MKVTALESNTQFRIQLGRAAEDARLHGVPFNILKPDHIVELDGQPYSLEWFHTEFSNMANTLIFTVTITCRATGQRVQYRVIQARRRTGTH
ncbi:hypothetical protein, partial [Deinococcus sp. LM3]|uniref:hypothetical protein n=1 Tax=Deinococcus sp. LM3 TaxID=1938608 RepID=UPI0009C84BC4